jgi:hypothetical protein
MGPSITLATPFSSYSFELGLSIVPLNAGTEGQLLLSWQTFPIDNTGPSTEASYVYDLTMGTTTDTELSSQDGNSDQEPRSSPDGRSVYSQEIGSYKMDSGGDSGYGSVSRDFSIFPAAFKLRALSTFTKLTQRHYNPRAQPPLSTQEATPSTRSRLPSAPTFSARAAKRLVVRPKLPLVSTGPHWLVNAG